MPVNLNALPPVRPLPAPPKKKRWLVFPVLLTVLLGAALRYFPHLLPPVSHSVRLIVVVIPALLGVIIYGLRLRQYENQYEYVEQWNGVRNRTETALIANGQRAVQLLDSAYSTPLASNKLSLLLTSQKPPLTPYYLTAFERPVAVRLFNPQPSPDNTSALGENLSRLLRQTLARIDRERMLAPCLVLVRHNEAVGDRAMRGLVSRTLSDLHLPVSDVQVNAYQDGVLWVDHWLDGELSAATILSIEIELQPEPIAGSTESVSAVLFAAHGVTLPPDIVPVASVHRPNDLAAAESALTESLLWGKVSEGDPFFVWQSQFEQEKGVEALIALNQAGLRVDDKNSHTLDTTLGQPLTGIGNLALICASEHAARTHLPQIVLLQDKTAQCCVIREYQQG